MRWTTTTRYEGYDEETDAFIYNVSMTGEKMTDDESEFNPEDFGLQGSMGEMGKMGLAIYRAVIRDGGTRHEAFDVTGAFFAGTMKATMEDNNDD